jgi:hypothetical protein
MNIYELEKQATQGPFDNGFPNERRDSAQRRLSAHCRNNFMKALEALHEQQPPPTFTDYTCRCHADDCPCCKWRQERMKLIAELEKVK